MQNVTLDAVQKDAVQKTVDALRNQIAEVVLDPDRWLITPHDLLGGREPNELLNSNSKDDQQRLRDLVESIKFGEFS